MEREVFYWEEDGWKLEAQCRKREVGSSKLKVESVGVAWLELGAVQILHLRNIYRVRIEDAWKKENGFQGVEKSVSLAWEHEVMFSPYSVCHGN